MPKTLNAQANATALFVLLSTEEMVIKKCIFGTFHVPFKKSWRKDSTKHLTSHYKLLVWKWQRGLFYYFISHSPYQPPSYQHPLQITHCNYPPPHSTTHTQTHTHTVIGETAFFSHNTKISMLSHTSICQVPLVSQPFHFALWIHTLCLVMIKSLKWMALRLPVDNLHWRTVVGVPLLQMLTLTL